MQAPLSGRFVGFPRRMARGHDSSCGLFLGWVGFVQIPPPNLHRHSSGSSQALPSGLGLLHKPLAEARFFWIGLLVSGRGPLNLREGCPSLGLASLLPGFFPPCGGSTFQRTSWRIMAPGRISILRGSSLLPWIPWSCGYLSPAGPYEFQGSWVLDSSLSAHSV